MAAKMSYHLYKAFIRAEGNQSDKRNRKAYSRGRDDVYLDYYGNDDRSEAADAVLIMPGGGYSMVCSDRAGEPVALAYLAKGINAFVLHYSVAGGIKDPLDPLTDASLAMLHIRANADKYNIDTARVFAGRPFGWRAPGRFTRCAPWNDAELQARLPETGGGNRPTGVVLCYPVISAGEVRAYGLFPLPAGQSSARRGGA